MKLLVMPGKWTLIAVAFGSLTLASGCGGGSAKPVVSRAHAFAGPKAALPLHVSPNRRYFVDRYNRPVFLVGDSPQAMVGDLSMKEAAHFLANRRAAGINALWVSLLCKKLIGCRDDGTTFDGVRPFRVADDLSTPNPAYFARARAMVRLAERAGIVVFLGPIETSGWLDVLRHNGSAKAFAYGRYVGRQFRSFRNVIWLNGNDFQSWTRPQDDALALAVARGIRSTAPDQLQTVELNYFRSGSLDDARWRSLIALDSAYTYYPTYAKVLREYGRKDVLPVVMLEAGYEDEQNVSWISPGDPAVLRRQEYWSALSGASGQFYGNHYTWQFADGWQDHLDTTGVAQLGFMRELFVQLPWYRLIPDRAHRVVSAGYGTFTTGGNVASSDYVTSASTADGTLAVSYLPEGGTLTVNTTRLVAGVRARWYDPASGEFRPNTGSGPLPRANRVQLTAPSKNAAADPDWVLVLSASRSR